MPNATAIPAAETGRQFLTFRLDRRLYALPADDVTEVIRVPAVARVPQAPPGLLGLANLRGEVLPIASLHGLLGEDGVSEGAAARAIVLGGSAKVALAVDGVEGLVAAGSDDLQAGRAELVAEAGERLVGAFETPDGVAKVLDLPGLLAAAFTARHRAVRIPRAASRAAATAGEEPTTSDGAGGSRRLVTFDLAGQEFALALDAVLEIVPAPSELTAAPGSEALVLGVAAYRDGLLPLMSLRGLLGFQASPVTDGRGSVIVARIGAVLVGLVADRMRAVLSADTSLIEPTPPVLAARTGGEAKITAIYRGEGGRRLISIVEPEQLFREEIMQRLERSGDHAPDVNEPVAATTDERLFLVFQLGGEEFALPIATVDEVALAPEQITRLPKTPAFLEGVINLRGQVLPVVDQRRRFGLPPRPTTPADGWWWCEPTIIELG